MSLEISRKGKLYVKKESSYGDTGVTFASADAMRHIDFGASFDPKGRVTSPEKKVSPGAVARFDRAIQAAFDLRSALIRPSGTLNTLPEADEIFEAAFGAKTNVTLATTVSSGGATTGAVVASAGTLAVGDPVLLSRSGVLYVRWLTAVAGTTLTWAPALPSVIANGESVKGCIGYKLSGDLSISLAFFHVLTNFRRLVIGAPVDRFGMRFGFNAEPMMSVSGPAQRQLTAGLPSTPAAFTTVGGNPPSGLIGELLIGATPYLFKDCDFDIVNGMRVRNAEFGNNGLASEAYRSGRREVMMGLRAFAETEATLYDLTEAGTETTVLKQSGRTQGNIIAVYCPRVEFKVPETDDGDEETNWSFRAQCLETADNMNDEIWLAFA